MVERSLCMREVAGPMPAFSRQENTWNMSALIVFVWLSQSLNYNCKSVCAADLNKMLQANSIRLSVVGSRGQQLQNSLSWDKYLNVTLRRTNVLYKLSATLCCKATSHHKHWDILAMMKWTPEQGLEPWTLRLKVWCSTDWAIQALLLGHSNDVWSHHLCEETIFSHPFFSRSPFSSAKRNIEGAFFDVSHRPLLQCAPGSTHVLARTKSAPEQGLEPWTLRLKVWCSTVWAIQALLEIHSYEHWRHMKKANYMVLFSWSLLSYATLSKQNIVWVFLEDKGRWIQYVSVSISIMLCAIVVAC